MQVAIFKYQEEDHFDSFTTIDIDGEAWFVASEICALLDIKNVSDAVSRLEDDEKNTIVITEGIRGNPNKVIISESGLYSLVFKSTKPEAKKFRKWVTSEVIPAIRKKGSYGKIDRSQAPNFYIRYKDNLHKIDRNYFSVISELFVTLNAELEKVGYQIPDKGADGIGIYPDISVGRMFSDYLKKNAPQFIDQAKTYPHSFPDDRPDQDAKMYPIEALPIFRKFVYDRWIPEQSQRYLGKKDPLILDYLPKLLEKE